MNPGPGQPFRTVSGYIISQAVQIFAGKTFSILNLDGFDDATAGNNFLKQIEVSVFQDIGQIPQFQ